MLSTMRHQAQTNVTKGSGLIEIDIDPDTDTGLDRTQLTASVLGVGERGDQASTFNWAYFKEQRIASTGPSSKASKDANYN